MSPVETPQPQDQHYSLLQTHSPNRGKRGRAPSCRHKGNTKQHKELTLKCAHFLLKTHGKILHRNAFQHDVHERRHRFSLLKKFSIHLQFGSLHPTKMDLNSQSQKIERTKMHHTIQNPLFVQRPFPNNNPLIQNSSRLRNVNTMTPTQY